MWDKIKSTHLPEYGAEFLGTAIIIFLGLSVVVFVFGQDSPLPENFSLRLIIVAILFSGINSLIVLSPIGKLSGGHFNPAVSFAFRLQNMVHNHDIFGYIIGQFLGGIFGAGLLRLVWGEYAGTVKYGVTFPDMGFWAGFIAEMVMGLIIVFSVFMFVSHHRLLSWTPLMVWALITALIYFGAPFSGPSLNPARSFGPAVVSWTWENQWLYLVAPFVGAGLGVLVYRLVAFGEREIKTAKLFHVSNYRCIFKNTKVEHRKDW